MLTIILSLAFIPLTIFVGYIVTLTASALLGGQPPYELAPPRRRFAVVIPAHDEATVIATTLKSLAQLIYPRERFEVHVIADNCTDATATIARAFGERLNLQVHERQDRLRRGKGYALSWLVDRLAPRTDLDAYVFLDADWIVSPTLLNVFDSYLEAGAEVVQAQCRVADPETSWPAALRSIAFALVNYVRPLGLTALGASCGLKGTGMAFSAGIIRELGWSSYSLIEDTEQHIKLLRSGRRAVFAPEAVIESHMPNTLRDSQSQNLRWESGKVALVREHAVPLARDVIRSRNGAALAELLGLLTPPLSVLFALCVGATLLARAFSRRYFAWCGIGLVGGIGAYVAAGIVILRPSRTVLRSLLYAPVFIAWKVKLFAVAVGQRGSGPWIRTSRPGEGRS